MTEPGRMVPIEEAIRKAEEAEAAEWNRPSFDGFLWLKHGDEVLRLRALAASGTTEVPG